ncbi:MAG: hypothetical protein ACI835_003644 [Planctomycetota bacterium]|jgi:hypothetical protein
MSLILQHGSLAVHERFVLSTKSECTDQMVFFGERRFRETATSYLEHYHTERADQGFDRLRIETSASIGAGEIECVESLGGMLKYYRRAA